ncbi:MAG: exodeoxyribonuclease VII large subunit [Chloroflexi bacterium]|nr:MAG: exodeoxyribonuclease VII large subunit [Chloroflexota bacterium]
MLKPEEARRPWTVSELARQIQAELQPLRSVFVKGEVSGMKLSAKGHYSFTIRDSAAVIEAFIFGNDARRLTMIPEDGQEFIFRGRIDYWAQGGRIRLLVDYLEFDDVGKLRARIELLKQRLELEGAFAPERKRPLPFLPRAVGLVTSPTGAVIHDLQQTIWDRFPNMDIVVYPAQVQGAASPGSVAGAIRQANRDGRVEVVVIARGGGSFEDLYGFNTEPVVRAILASRIPVVTALGHTSDRTLADMASDAECRTPTEAGARVVPRKAQLAQQLGERARRLEREGLLRLQAGAEAVARRRERLAQVLPAQFALRARRLERARADLARLSPAQQLTRRRGELVERGRRIRVLAEKAVGVRRLDLERRRAGPALVRLAGDRFGRARLELEHRRERLANLSPETVLARGYSITSDEETGEVLKSAAATEVRRRVKVRLASGTLKARVEEVAG